MKTAIRWGSLGFLLALFLTVVTTANADGVKNDKDTDANAVTSQVAANSKSMGTSKSHHKHKVSKENKEPKGWKKGKKKGWKGKDEPKGIEKKETSDAEEKK